MRALGTGRMILPDSNIWIDHLRRRDETLAMLLIAKQARLHPFILGEISLGSQGAARAMLATIGEVRACVTATLAEVLAFITSASLHGTGIGYVDTHLLAATRLT
ncbi:MAG: VapC toxin family PIN domain ribonuclease, partial [Novosphingobium sp.]